MSKHKEEQSLASIRKSPVDFTYDGDISINFRGYDVNIELVGKKAILHHPKNMPDNVEKHLIEHVENEIHGVIVKIGSSITQRDFTEDVTEEQSLASIGKYYK